MSLIDYHKATTKELLSIKNKVRSLVRHWGEDGRYQEVVLKNMISRFLPAKYSIATGFVVRQTENRGDHISSRQIDLLIYDNASPVLFKEGDFVILTADAVRGIIEVKANIQNQNLTEIVDRANENGKFIVDGKEDKDSFFFNGVFGYEGFMRNANIDLISEQIIEANTRLQGEPDFEKFKVNHIAFNKNIFFKYWMEEELPNSIYDVEDLSFSFFISNLVDSVANKSVNRNNFLWYATDKELNLVRSF